MADPLRAAVERVGDQLEAGRLARVDRQMGEPVPGDRDRVAMVTRREPRLGAGEVERDDRVVVATAAHAQLGDLAGARPRCASRR